MNQPSLDSQLPQFPRDGARPTIDSFSSEPGLRFFVQSLFSPRCPVLIFALSGLVIQIAHAGQIIQKPLDEFVIYSLPIAFKSGNTTVLFPSAISALYAKSVAVQEQPNADFLISFTPGNYYFTVRALKPDAEDHLTVIYNRKAYVLHLSASDKPFYTVTFFQDATPRGPARPIVPERLLSLLDKAKAYPLFEKDYPDALAGVLHAAPNATNYYDKFRLLIRDVWRFEQEDTLVFRLELENNSDSTIYYKTTGSCRSARGSNLHTVDCRCLRRDAAKVHHTRIFRDHRQRPGRTQQSCPRQQVERSWSCAQRANSNRGSSNESAPNLDGDISKACRQAASSS